MSGVKTEKVLVRSPMRVDLSGGTLDLWPLYLFFEKSFVVNFSIDLYTQVKIQERKDSAVHIDISNFKYKKKFSNLKSLLNSRKKTYLRKNQASKEEILSFLIPHFKYWMPKKGFFIQTLSESPLQAGIGGSSSLCMSLIQAFSIWLKKEKIKKEDRVRLASSIEASGLGFPTGTQDYLPCMKSGLHIIQYGLKKKLFFKKLTSDWKKVFKKHILLIDTGIPHHSALLNWNIYKAFLEGESKVTNALEKLSNISEKIAQICLKNNWDELSYWINQEFLIRLKMSKSFANQKILSLRKEIFKKGGKAFKLCGAGGGGVALIWLDSDEDKERVIHFLEKNSIHLLKTNPKGTQIILSLF